MQKPREQGIADQETSTGRTRAPLAGPAARGKAQLAHPKTGRREPGVGSRDPHPTYSHALPFRMGRIGKVQLRPTPTSKLRESGAASVSGDRPAGPRCPSGGAFRDPTLAVVVVVAWPVCLPSGATPNRVALSAWNPVSVPMPSRPE